MQAREATTTGMEINPPSDLAVTTEIKTLHAEQLLTLKTKALYGEFVKTHMVANYYVVPANVSIKIFVDGMLAVYKTASDPISQRILTLFDSKKEGEEVQLADKLKDEPRPEFRGRKPRVLRTSIGYLGSFAPSRDELRQGFTGIVTGATTFLTTPELETMRDSAILAEQFISQHLPETHQELAKLAQSKVGVMSGLQYVSTMTANYNYPSKFHTDNNGNSQKGDASSWNYMVVYKHEKIKGGDLAFPELQVEVNGMTYQGIVFKLETGNSTVFNGTKFMHGNIPIQYEKGAEDQEEIDEKGNPIARRSFVYYSKGRVTEEQPSNMPSEIRLDVNSISIKQPEIATSFSGSRHPNLIVFNGATELKMKVQLDKMTEEMDPNGDEFRLALLRVVLKNLNLVQGDKIVQVGIPLNHDITLEKHLYFCPGLSTRMKGAQSENFNLDKAVDIEYDESDNTFSFGLRLMVRNRFENALEVFKKNELMNEVIPYSLQFNNQPLGVNFCYVGIGRWQLINKDVKNFEKLFNKDKLSENNQPKKEKRPEEENSLESNEQPPRKMTMQVREKRKTPSIYQTRAVLFSVPNGNTVSSDMPPSPSPSPF